MRRIGISTLSCCIPFIFGCMATAHASDETVIQSPGGDFTLLGGVGYAWLKSHEIVFDTNGNRVSELFWDGETPTVTLGANAKFASHWTVSAKVDFGVSGSGDMRDYDWLEQAPSYNFNDWSSRSIHPDTKLNRYIDLDVALGRDFELSDTTVVNLQGGFKYTDIKWTARGGSILNSTQNGFRDNSETFPDGQNVLTFEQRLPAVFLGAGATTAAGRWTFSGTLRGGVTVGASDTDHHWLRNLRFEEEYDAIPFVTIDANVEYALNERATLYLGGSYDKYFQTEGDSMMYDKTNGTQTLFKDAAGLDFRSVSLSAGVKVAF